MGDFAREGCTRVDDGDGDRYGNADVEAKEGKPAEALGPPPLFLEDNWVGGQEEVDDSIHESLID